MIVGIMGGGQLARMLALAGLPMGLRFVFLDPAPDACAAPLGRHLCGDYNNPEHLDSLAKMADIVTYEFENVPEQSTEILSARVEVYPGTKALATTRDRLREKQMFRQLGIPTAEFAAINSLADLRDAVSRIGFPAVLKTRLFGYDGKGQIVLRKHQDVDPAWEQLGNTPLILEQFVDFQREISIVAARGKNGDTAFYPVSENIHREGILRVSRARAEDEFQNPARAYAQKVLDHLEYVGVMALELFQAEGALLANEVAPRVHNSGHWTIEGAETSQFENHLRAILGLPLGSTRILSHTAMLNIIGELPDQAEILQLPDTHLHLYDKLPKAGRKLGHVTIRSACEEDLSHKLAQLRVK